MGATSVTKKTPYENSYRKRLANARPSNGGSLTKCERTGRKLTVKPILQQEKLSSSTYASVSALALRKWSGTPHILQSDSCGNQNKCILIHKRVRMCSYAKTKRVSVSNGTRTCRVWHTPLQPTPNARFCRNGHVAAHMVAYASQIDTLFLIL